MLKLYNANGWTFYMQLKYIQLTFGADHVSECMHNILFQFYSMNKLYNLHSFFDIGANSLQWLPFTATDRKHLWLN